MCVRVSIDCGLLSFSCSSDFLTCMCDFLTSLCFVWSVFSCTSWLSWKEGECVDVVKNERGRKEEGVMAVV